MNRNIVTNPHSFTTKELENILDLKKWLKSMKTFIVKGYCFRIHKYNPKMIES